MLDLSNIHSLWASLIIEECIRNGVDYFCISPGSRSTPLTVAAARNPKAKTIICYDERGAAFHALGYGRATGKPAVLICTSGTAVANYFPAVIEADVDNVPLLILGADRPPELRDTMANQTIVQAGIFGRYVRYFFDLPAPTMQIAPQMVLSTIDQAIYRTQETPGPVHINCMYRKPLDPDLMMDGNVLNYLRNHIPDYPYIEPVDASTTPKSPYTSYAKTAVQADTGHVQQLIAQSEHGVISVGQLKNEAERQAALNLIDGLGWPTIVDITSGLRLGSSDHPNILPYFDLTLLYREGVDSISLPHPPDTILHIGGQMVSKRFLDWTGRIRPKTHIVVKDSPTRHDPAHTVTHRFDVSLPEFLNATAAGTESNGSADYLTIWQSLSNKASSVVRRLSSNLTEPAIAQLISAEIPQAAALFIGNSMPIRDMDMFAVADGARVPVAANRGASGIDGNLATACGFAVGLNRPTTILLGDLTLLHDLNSLSLLRYIEQPMTIVVINNSGGGIFHMLPIRRSADVFEPNFGTPHDFGFAHAAAMFGLHYESPQTVDAFRTVYRNAQRHTLIEICTDRNENYDLHQSIYAAIRTA